jgi:diguanylate cyclase (GGDEF)-like protein/PAS domain S-box-containing protein
MAGGRPGAVTRIADALRAPGALDDPETVAAAEEVGLGIISVDGAGRVRWSDSAYRWHGRPRWQRVRTVEDSLSEVQVGGDELRAVYAALATGSGSSQDAGVRYIVTGEHKVAHTVYLLPIGRGTALVSGRPFEAEEWDGSPAAPAEPAEPTVPSDTVARALEEIVGSQDVPESAVTGAVLTADVTIDLTDSARASLDAGSRVDEPVSKAARDPRPSQWRELFVSSPVAMVLLDRDDHLHQANDAFCALVGAGRNQVLALDYGPLLAAAIEASALDDGSAEAAEHTGQSAAEHRLRRPDGDQRWVRLRTAVVELEGALHRLVTVEDLTTVRETEYRLRREALHDQLTGLPNRRLLVDRLDRALTRGRRTQAGVAVFFIDVDDLKRVNDTYGHAGGDLMIVTVARALRAALRDADTLARIGGDEFVAVCEDLDDGRSLDEVGDRLIHAVNAPLVLDGDHVTISLSVGVATPHEGGEDAESLLERADAAMYRAKAAGGGRLSTSPRPGTTGGEAEVAIADWLAAMSAGQLRLEYLPVVRADDGQVLGVEGRLRWRHPSLGELTAIDLLDSPGANRATAELVRWSVRQALTDVQAATPAGSGPLTLWLTVPFRALVQHGVADAVAVAYRDQHGRNVPQLVLEIQERGLASLIRRGKPPRELDRLVSAGPVSVGVGRFDGCALPLGILARLPLGSVKLHRDLVNDATHAEAPAMVMTGLVTGVNTLGVVTVASGVDHAEHLRMARAAGVVAVQGKFVGNSVSAKELADVLALTPVWFAKDSAALETPELRSTALSAVVPTAPVAAAVAATRSELLLAGERIDLTVDIGEALAAETGVPLPGDFVPGAPGQVDRSGGDAGTSRPDTGPHLLLRPPRLTPMVANAS